MKQNLYRNVENLTIREINVNNLIYLYLKSIYKLLYDELLTQQFILFLFNINFVFLLIFPGNDLMEMDDCDDAMGSDLDDHISETDSKKGGSRGSRGSDGKSQGTGSKPRRYR